jgi:uncharacterized damage-inducible protein DinB
MRIALGVMLLAAASACAAAQDASSSVTASSPVVASAKEIFVRQSAYVVQAADEMPAEKYGYRPTPEQWTYGKIVSHVALANYHVCGMLSGDGPGSGPAVADTASKDELLSALKQSFDVCQKALDGLSDSNLGGTITFFGGAKKPRARALLELTGDLEDHYSQMASYLRLNGMLPPSAKK